MRLVISRTQTHTPNYFCVGKSRLTKVDSKQIINLITLLNSDRLLHIFDTISIAPRHHNGTGLLGRL
jgi:hypothetical protein